MRGWLALLALLASLGTARADYSFSGTRLLEICQNTKDENEFTLCLTYIEGLYGGMIAAGAATGVHAICPPQEANTALPNLIVIIVRYGKAHPDILKLPWPGVAAAALAETFPCVEIKHQ